MPTLMPVERWALIQKADLDDLATLAVSKLGGSYSFSVVDSDPTWSSVLSDIRTDALAAAISGVLDIRVAKEDVVAAGINGLRWLYLSAENAVDYPEWPGFGDLKVFVPSGDPAQIYMSGRCYPVSAGSNHLHGTYAVPFNDAGAIMVLGTPVPAGPNAGKRFVTSFVLDYSGGGTPSIGDVTITSNIPSGYLYNDGTSFIFEYYVDPSIAFQSDINLEFSSSKPFYSHPGYFNVVIFVPVNLSRTSEKVIDDVTTFESFTITESHRSAAFMKQDDGSSAWGVTGIPSGDIAYFRVDNANDSSPYHLFATTVNPPQSGLTRYAGQRNKYAPLPVDIEANPKKGISENTVSNSCEYILPSYPFRKSDESLPSVTDQFKNQNYGAIDSITITRSGKSGDLDVSVGYINDSSFVELQSFTIPDGENHITEDVLWLTTPANVELVYSCDEHVILSALWHPATFSANGDPLFYGYKAYAGYDGSVALPIQAQHFNEALSLLNLLP